MEAAMDWIWTLLALAVLGGVLTFVLPFLPGKRNGKNSVDVES
jgi:hypothetical protein